VRVPDATMLTVRSGARGASSIDRENESEGEKRETFDEYPRSVESGM